MKLAELVDIAALITPSQADVLFHQRKGTAMRACRAGLVKCREAVNRGGKPSFKIDLRDARRLWGCE